jgi:hypothetical protein
MKERRAATALGALLGLAACFFLFISFKERSAAGRTASKLQAAEQNYQALSRSRSEARKEWQGWQDAQNDLAELKKDYLYDGKTVMQDMRLDLKRIYDAAGISVTNITYGYSELVKGSIMREAAEFEFSGNYMMFKRLLAMIERHPRLLHVEKIDFLNIGREPGLVDLKITIAGYYEN